jgi:hypothetical protein
MILIPGQCYPIDQRELDYKFMISNDFTENEWSSAIRIRTIAEKVAKGATVRDNLSCSLDLSLSWKVIHYHHEGEVRVLKELQHQLQDPCLR